jgi:hypothetical protein
MRVGSVAATTIGVAALLVARPSGAGQAPAVSVDRGSLAEDVRAVNRDLWFVASAGLRRLGYSIPARAISRHIVATADNSFDACLGQAGVIWQTDSEEAAMSEWNKLDHLVKEVELDRDSSSTDIATCRDVYRRVTGDLILRALSGCHNSPVSVEKHRLERVRAVFSAYLAAVQQDIAANGAAPRR